MRVTRCSFRATVSRDEPFIIARPTGGGATKISRDEPYAPLITDAISTALYDCGQVASRAPMAANSIANRVSAAGGTRASMAVAVVRRRHGLQQRLCSDDLG